MLLGGLGGSSRVWLRYGALVYSMRSLRLKAADSGPQHAEGESPDEQRVDAASHERFRDLEAVFGFLVERFRKGIWPDALGIVVVQ